MESNTTPSVEEILSKCCAWSDVTIKAEALEVSLPTIYLQWSDAIEELQRRSNQQKLRRIATRSFQPESTQLISKLNKGAQLYSIDQQIELRINSQPVEAISA